MEKMDIFLSYCHQDSEEADRIYDYFKNSQQIELHRDVIDVKKWDSFKVYMQSVSKMDYVILLISDSYLKSDNCMYEVLEVIKDPNYRNKIFPAVISHEIYDPFTRAKYVKHWQDEFEKLHETLKDIAPQNLGRLSEDLKRRQAISSNIAEFLDVVSDMNNPHIDDICESIVEKLTSKGFIKEKSVSDERDLSAVFGIQSLKYNTEPTDLEKNEFMKDSFKQINDLFFQICQFCENNNSWIQIRNEQIDSHNVIYRFYKNGRLIRSIKIFLSGMFGGIESIGVSTDVMSISSNRSWNGIYDIVYINGELKMCDKMSFTGGKSELTNEEVAADIWEKYIKGYIE